MAEWTPALVEEHLRKAIALKGRRQPDHAAPPIASPPGRESIGTIGGIEADQVRDDVVQMATEALSWLRWLNPADADIVVAWLEGARWKMICWCHGVSRPTADRRWRYALALIAWRLKVPASRSSPSLRSLLARRERRLGV